MSGSSILFQTTNGRLGARSRPELGDTVESVWLDGTTPPTQYGLAVKDNGSGNVSALTATATISQIIGVLTQPTVDTQPSVLNEAFGVNTPNPIRAHGLLRRGRIFMSCLGTTAPARNGQVYVRVADTGATGRPLGTVEAAAIATDVILWTGVTFAGGRDSNNVVEVNYNL